MVRVYTVRILMLEQACKCYKLAEAHASKWLSKPDSKVTRSECVALL